LCIYNQNLNAWEIKCAEWNCFDMCFYSCKKETTTISVYKWFYAPNSWGEWKQVQWIVQFHGQAAKVKWGNLYAHTACTNTSTTSCLKRCLGIHKNSMRKSTLWAVYQSQELFQQGQSEQAPTRTPCRMDGVWTGNALWLYSCPMTNHRC
jgi:hypothetical protein